MSPSWKTHQVTVASGASWKIQAAARRPQKFHGNPNAKNRALFWNSTYYRRACLRIKRHAKRVVSVQERGVVSWNAPEREKKKRTLTQSVYCYWELASTSAAAYQFFNSNSHCGEILYHKKIGAFSPFLDNITSGLCRGTAVMQNAFISTFLHS